MGKITKEFETEYNVGDVVVYKKNNMLFVGIIEGYYIDDDNFWFNIRVNDNFVHTYSNGGDVAEWDIIGVLPEELAKDCKKKIIHNC